MKLVASASAEDVLTDELLALLVEEAEKALLLVEARADEQGRRVLDGDAPDREAATAPGVSELRLALAELVDAHPSFALDLESIGERMKSAGARAGSSEIEAYAHVLDLVRLSLQVHFRLYPTAEAYEADQRLLLGSTYEEEVRTPSETYELYGQLLSILKDRLS